MLYKITLVLLLSIFSLGCSAIGNSTKPNGSFLNLWNLDKEKYFPSSNDFQIHQVAKFDNSVFEEMKSRIGSRFSFYAKDYSCVLEGDTLAFGFQYVCVPPSDQKAKVGLIFVDSLGSFIRCSKEYNSLAGPHSFRNQVFYEKSDHSIQQLGKIHFNNVFFTRDADIPDSVSLKTAFCELKEQLLLSKIIDDSLEIIPKYCYFTNYWSYFYDKTNHLLHYYDVLNKQKGSLLLPVNNAVLNSALFELGSQMNFVGIAGHYIVFSSIGYWTTILIDMRSENFFMFLSTSLSERLNIKDIEQYNIGFSGYQLLIIGESLYYQARTTKGDIYFFKLEIKD